jgi:sialic acid synthase SpsE
MHDRRTIRTALAAFKGNIYQKHILYVPELSYPTPKKYINLKGLNNKKLSCMRCH